MNILSALRSGSGRISIFIEWISRRSIFVALTTFLGVFVGLWGSLYSAEIKSGFPFVPGSGVTPEEAQTFWWLLAVFTACFLATQWAQNRSTRRAQRELIEKSDQLERLVRTMPPEDFLAKFDGFCVTSHQAATLALTKESTPEAVEEAIRVILECIISLAHFFDGRPNDARYSANIMLFVKSEALDKERRDELRARLHFAPLDVDIGALDGVLDLDLPLSATQENAGGPDTRLAPFALPVPRVKDHDVDGERKYRVLPGAPWAIAYRRVAGFADLAEFEHWARKQGDFSPGTISDMLRYFQTGKGRAIRSFFSVPLMSREGDPVGVLNLNRNLAGMLGERAWELFLPFTSPFRLLLAELIELRQQRTVR